MISDLESLIRESNYEQNRLKKYGSSNEAYNFLRNRVKTQIRNSNLWKVLDEMGLNKLSRDTVALPVSLDKLSKHFVRSDIVIIFRDLWASVRISLKARFFLSTLKRKMFSMQSSQLIRMLSYVTISRLASFCKHYM